MKSRSIRAIGAGLLLALLAACGQQKQEEKNEEAAVPVEIARVTVGAIDAAYRGTATLEAACFGTPMVVLYRLSRLSYVIARLLVRGVSHIALPNIVAGRTVVPELIQDQALAARVGAVALDAILARARHVRLG